MADKFELYGIEWMLGDQVHGIRREIREAVAAGQMTEADQKLCDEYLWIAGGEHEDLGPERTAELVRMIEAIRHTNATA